MKKKILLDIDEVFCFSGYLELVNEFLGANYKIDDFKDYYIDEVAIPTAKKEAFYEFASTKDQYAKPVILPGALEALSILSKYYDIYPCSDCRNPFDLKNSGRIFKSKFEMLYRLIPEEVIPAKNVCVGDIQIDDLVSNLNPDIPIRILFPSYHNKNVSDEKLKELGIIRAGYDYRTGWQEVCKILLEPKIVATAKEKKLGLKKQGIK